MKKISALLLVAASLGLSELPLSAEAAAVATVAKTTVANGRPKPYRTKRGGLFNTGLFRKKNPCGCPKH